MRSQATTREIVRGEAAPAPLVFQFVENIFRIAAIAIELPEGREFLIKRGYQHAVFVDFGVGADFDERELLLTVFIGPDAAELLSGDAARRSRDVAGSSPPA